MTFRCRAVDRVARTGASGGDILAKKKPGLSEPAGEGVGLPEEAFARVARELCGLPSFLGPLLFAFCTGGKGSAGYGDEAGDISMESGGGSPQSPPPTVGTTREPLIAGEDNPPFVKGLPKYPTLKNVSVKPRLGTKFVV